MGFCYAEKISGAFSAEYVWESCWHGGAPPPPLPPQTPPRPGPNPPPLLRSNSCLPEAPCSVFNSHSILWPTAPSTPHGVGYCLRTQSPTTEVMSARHGTIPPPPNTHNKTWSSAA